METLRTKSSIMLYQQVMFRNIPIINVLIMVLYKHMYLYLVEILYCYILAWILKLTMLLDLFFIIVDINNKLVVGIFVVRCLKEPIVVKRECFWWLVNFLLIVKILHKFMYIYIYKLIILKSKWIALLCNNTVYLTHCCAWGCRYLQHTKM